MCSLFKKTPLTLLQENTKTPLTLLRLFCNKQFTLLQENTKTPLTLLQKPLFYLPVHIFFDILVYRIKEKKQASSEIDLVFRVGSRVIPIEIKAGATGTLKSLHEFMDRTDHPYAVRIYAGEFEIQEIKTPKGTPYFLMNLPYYLGTQIPKYLNYFVTNYKMK